MIMFPSSRLKLKLSCLKSSLLALCIVFLSVLHWSLAERCTHLQNRAGTCRLLNDCSPAKELLAQSRTDRNGLRNLQILTRSCGYTRQNPQVCCLIEGTQGTSSSSALRFVDTVNTNQFPKKATESLSRLRVSTGFSSHPNFKKLPSIQQCSNAPISDRIVGGHDAPFGAYPWVARLGYEVISSGQIVYGCAGTVLNEKTILTAAHCLENLASNLRLTQIRLAEYNTKTDPDCSPRGNNCVPHQDFSVERVLIHPNYETKSKFNDVALIFVKGRISFNQPRVQPVCLPFIKEYGLNGISYVDNKETIVAGFGKTKWNRGAGSSVLQHVDVVVVPNNECQREYAATSRITINSSQLCARGHIGKDSCDGDSGGPLMINSFNGGLPKLIQLGVISYGPQKCGVSGLPGVYTRITDYLGWILDNLQ